MGVSRDSLPFLPSSSDDGHSQFGAAEAHMHMATCERIEQTLEENERLLCGEFTDVFLCGVRAARLILNWQAGEYAAADYYAQDILALLLQLEREGKLLWAVQVLLMNTCVLAAYFDSRNDAVSLHRLFSILQPLEKNSRTISLINNQVGAAAARAGLCMPSATG